VVSVSEFRFGLGHITLEFVATLSDRPGRRIERLAEPEDLTRWLSEARLAEQPRVTARILDQARTLREATYRVLAAARAGQRPSKPDLEVLNEWARRPTHAPQIDRNLHRTLVAPHPTAAALAYVARESIKLLTGPDLPRVRSCAGCSLLFVDRSRPGRRRWCSMDRCGNRDKTARYREKRQHA
jgi:predicted RNA-binding Zn ribbon-like protein